MGLFIYNMRGKIMDIKIPIQNIIEPQKSDILIVEKQNSLSGGLKMKNVMKGIGIIVLIILVLTVGLPKTIEFIKYRDSEEAFTDNILTKDIEASMSAKQSDIEGWTMLDKLNAGLQPIEGCDSDGDGLTDKEEIEIYGTDPAKASTSGDLYTDGYKVEHNMDLHTYYEYKEESIFKNNDCEDVSLAASSASDFNGHISSLYNINIEGYTVYKAYDVYSFSGDMTINVSDIEDDGLVVLVGPWHGGDMDKASTELSGNDLSVKYDFDAVKRYTVAVAKSDSIFNTFSKPSFDLALNTSDDSEVALDDANFLFAHAFFFRNLFYNAKPSMYYVSTGDTDSDNRIKRYLIGMANEVLDGMVDVSDEDVKEISPAKMKILKNFFGKHEENRLLTVNTNYCKAPHFIFMWCDSVIYDVEAVSAQVTNIVDVVEKRSSNTGFLIYSDAFPFQNFKSEYAQSGNCAGIAYYTAKIFNDGTAPSSGSYSSTRYENNAGTVSWDISGDSDNKTLLDKNLYGYKDASFVSDHKNDSGLIDGLSSGENEFVKMIGSYWALTNDAADPSNNIYYVDSSTGVYSWDIIEQMMDALDDHKILILGMMNSQSAGHVVNVTNYTKSVDGNSVKFELYDNDFPCNQKKGKKIDNTLTVTKINCEKGCPESFSYYYKPYDDCKYEYNSDNNINGYKFFCVMDSELNKLK